MKTALLSDIHGNLEALTAVLSDIDRHPVDSIHCLGDVVGYGCNPTACLDLVNKYCDIKLLGNHEYTVLGLQSTRHYNDAARAAAGWTQAQLTQEALAIIADFDLDRTLNGVYLVHASPYEPDRWHYIFTTEQAYLAFKHLPENLGFFGHSHVPQIFTETASGAPRTKAAHDFLPDRETRHLVNVGSVGQPRDNDPRACYVVYDDEEHEIFFRRVEYDIRTTQQKMADASLPEVLISRLSVGV